MMAKKSEPAQITIPPPEGKLKIVGGSMSDEFNNVVMNQDRIRVEWDRGFESAVSWRQCKPLLTSAPTPEPIGSEF